MAVFSTRPIRSPDPFVSPTHGDSSSRASASALDPSDFRDHLRRRGLRQGPTPDLGRRRAPPDECSWTIASGPSADIPHWRIKRAASPTVRDQVWSLFRGRRRGRTASAARKRPRAQRNTPDSGAEAPARPSETDGSRDLLPSLRGTQPWSSGAPALRAEGAILHAGVFAGSLQADWSKRQSGWTLRWRRVSGEAPVPAFSPGGLLAAALRTGYVEFHVTGSEEGPASHGAGPTRHHRTCRGGRSAPGHGFCSGTGDPLKQKRWV